MKKYIAIVHEKGEYDFQTKYEFESMEELHNFMKNMRGVLFASEVYSVESDETKTPIL